MSIVIVMLIVLVALIFLRELGRDRHRQPRVTEWQARKNAAPLSSAVSERHVHK